MLLPQRRVALVAAVRQLLCDPRLDDPRLKGAREIVRLAVLILLCKAPAKSPFVKVQAKDFAGWLGCSVSYFTRVVRVLLEEVGLVVVTPVRNDSGWVDKLRYELLPLREARTADVSSPLAALGKRDLTVLLRVAEAVTCPGWAASEDNPEPTPPGFMDFEQKKNGSAAIRLAALLLVLRCRVDGRVPMTAGKVKEGFSRAAATLAKVTGWSLATASRAVDRMERDGVLALGEGSSGDAGGRMCVAAVSVAYSRFRSLEAAAETPDAVVPAVAPSSGPEHGRCLSCANHVDATDGLVLEGDGWAQESFDDALEEANSTAFRDQTSLDIAKTLGTPGTDGTADAVATSDIHATHPPVVALSGFSAGDLDCFSGSAGGGSGDRRGDARAGEDQPGGSRALVMTGVPGAGQGPLRGEKQNRSSRKAGGDRLLAPGSVPLDLQVALAPVAGLWRMITVDRTARWMAVVVRDALRQVAYVVGPEQAQIALAERLSRRIAEQTTPVRDAVGWLRRRGLPQRQGCWLVQCDDGLRMDTRGPCECCATRLRDRQNRLRQLMEAASGGSWAGLAPEQRSAIERQVNQQYRHQAEADAVRREKQRTAQAERDAAIACQRLDLQEERAAVQAHPCGSCGRPGVAGKCPTCRSQRLAERSVRAAVDVAVALRADLSDLPAVEELTRKVEADTWKVVGQHHVLDGEGAADIRRHLADQVLAQRRARALARLAQSPLALEEGQLVYRCALSRPAVRGESRRDVQAWAEHEAEHARQKVAHTLLEEFLADLAEVRRRVAEAAEVTV